MTRHFFVTKFIGRLHIKIQKSIRLHDPRIIDVVLSLALTHEEPLEEAR